MNFTELKPEQLYHRCDPDTLDFESTEDVEPLEKFIGQPRAVEALRFGIGMQRNGYNVFALGEEGTGKYTLIRNLLDTRAREQETPPDLCYVNNFDEHYKPRLLKMAPGRGKELSKAIDNLVEEIRSALRAAFESEEFQNRHQSIDEELREKQQELFQKIQKMAEEEGMAPLRTPAGLVFAPVKDGEVVQPDELEKLSEEERREMEKKAEQLQKETQKLFQKIPQWQREFNEKHKQVNKEIIQYTVSPLIRELIDKFEDNTSVKDYLEAVEKDIIENARSFFQEEQMQQAQGARGQGQQGSQMPSQSGQQGGADLESGALRRYRVNVLVDNSETEGAPVIREENPDYQNLFGRVEHLAQMGALITDFNMIRAGSLHRANGGFIILNVLKVLQEPFVYESLKRALRSKKLRIETLGQKYSLISTVSLEPQPLELDIKVILTGSPMLYYMLRHYDPEFSELFKVSADFAYVLDRNEENQAEYARLIASAIKKENVRPFGSDAVARVIEHSARKTGDSEKLSMHMEGLLDLLREADYWASQNGNGKVTAQDVQKAIDSWIYRSDRLRERMQEQITREIVVIDTEGEKVGQINGLSVIQLGDFAFGRPSRITARVRLGKGDVVDIEREVAMGGPIHSKGVLILSGFLGARYAMEHPLSLSASLVFEQSYGGIEGDSASSAELYCLLSSIAKVPIKQNFAVTGSVDQHGTVQAIGGVNEKIEGFFDICNARGLTGEQGVLIPRSNTRHLMLRQDVIDAVEAGKFHVYPIETIDQGIELLTGIAAGEPDEEGKYPEDSVNGKVFKTLSDLAEKRQKFVQAAAPKEG